MFHNKTLLLTGGLGYIGSHTTACVAEAGYQPIIVDNLVNSQMTTLDHLKTLCPSNLQPVFYQLDIRDTQALRDIILRHNIVGVMHFAALKSVPRSVADPLEYYDNNINGLVSLLRALPPTRHIPVIYSSSAAIYQSLDDRAITEKDIIAPINPYGHTKVMGEQILADWAATRSNAATACLRYFNPIGAHPSGLLADAPVGVPSNLLPYIVQVARGERPVLTIYGDDYDTVDGTAVRDYLHVMDLGVAHLRVFEVLWQNPARLTLNLGTGTGHTVRQVVSAFERVIGRPLPTQIGPRRPGDLAILCSDPSQAQKILGWRADHDLETMVRDAAHAGGLLKSTHVDKLGTV